MAWSPWLHARIPSEPRETCTRVAALMTTILMDRDEELEDTWKYRHVHDDADGHADHDDDEDDETLQADFS